MITGATFLTSSRVRVGRKMLNLDVTKCSGLTWFYTQLPG